MTLGRHTHRQVCAATVPATSVTSSEAYWHHHALTGGLHHPGAPLHQPLHNQIQCSNRETDFAPCRVLQPGRELHNSPHQVGVGSAVYEDRWARNDADATLKHLEEALVHLHKLFSLESRPNIVEV